MNSTKGLKQRTAPLLQPATHPVHSTLTEPGDTSAAGIKKTRKVVNCEPCRANKSKCDRNRPCSSCNLRGTSYQCYRDVEVPEAGSSQGALIDPLAEIRKIRRSINAIELSIRYQQGQPTAGVVEARQDPQPGPHTAPRPVAAMTLANESSSTVRKAAETLARGPGARGSQFKGFYAGPTSASSHLIHNDIEDVDPLPALAASIHTDILNALPDPDLIEQIIEYHFTYCQWIIKTAWEKSFHVLWDEYMVTGTTDSLVLATFCGTLALTMVFIPNEHPLKLATIRRIGPDPHEKLFRLMHTIQLHYEATLGSSAYSLDYAEILLIRGYYYLYAVQAGEEIWANGCRLISVATAMGLHRDPSQWKMPLEVAERRRWLWWEIVTWCRWQSMLIGRPPLISMHHCDTQFPLSGADLDSLSDAVTCDAHRRLFMLGNIIDAITDDALSLGSVPYSNIRQHDKKLGQWKSDLPSSWNMGREDIMGGICSDDLVIRKRAVQCVCMLSGYHYIRFTLHRPYASRSPTAIRNIGETKLESIESVGIACTSAESLINLMVWCQCAFHLPPERACSTPAYFSYISFYLFTAAMFFSFQLIASPKGTRSTQCRNNIGSARKALIDLTSDMPGGRLAANAIKILDTLEPLWNDGFIKMLNGQDKEELKTKVLASVRQLAFPFHDPEAARTATALSARSATATKARVGETEAMTSSDATASTHTLRHTFGTYGTLTPDMSISGLMPGARVETREHDLKPQASQGDGYHPSSSYSSDQTWASTEILDLPPAVYDRRLTNQSMQQAPPTPVSTGSWMAGAPSDYFSRGQPQAPPQGSFSLHRDAWTQAYGTPTSVGIQYNTTAGPISQEASWGASVGIEAGEWAGFMLLMTDATYSNEIQGAPM